MVAGISLAGLAFTTQAAELNSIGWSDGMYMAYFDITEGGVIEWTNSQAMSRDQILYPIASTNYYASTTAFWANGIGSPDPTVETAAWAGVLNPPAQGGGNAPFSRWFGFSLNEGLAGFLGTDKALAIRLNSVTYKGTSDVAENVQVYYYNNGTNDMNMAAMYDSDHVAWSALSASNYLVWDGAGFMNMLHPVVVSTDPFAAEYTLNFTVTVVDDLTGSSLALVSDSATEVAGVTGATLSYNFSSPGVPEPSVALLLMVGCFALFLHRREGRRRSLVSNL